MPKFCKLQDQNACLKFGVYLFTLLIDDNYYDELQLSIIL